MTTLKNPIDIAEYLFRRLHQVGVRSVFGVPGDYNLAALDYIPQAGLNWVGNCNELNAGYAADGYARLKGISALITTFGVGELSLLNAIAGAYSEYVPIVHIVGTPSTRSQTSSLMLHHTLGNGDFNVFFNMSRSISCAMVNLLHAAKTPEEIPSLLDNVIRECYVKSRPVYIALPSDLVTMKIEGAGLDKEIDLKFAPNDAEKEDYVVGVVMKYLNEAKNPVILVDSCAIRHRALEEVHSLITSSSLPTFVTPMGKSAVYESLPNFVGVYAGTGSSTPVRQMLESADLILLIGSIKSDFNTGGFTFRIGAMNTIDFHSTHVQVRYAMYDGVRMNGVLRKVVERMDWPSFTARLQHPSGDITPPDTPQSALDDASQSDAQFGSSTIHHAYLWPRISHFLKPYDIVVTETGTSNFGIWKTRFPKGVVAISQVLWGSIGYATGATLGAVLAQRELGEEFQEGKGKEVGKGRTILFTGDGSFQLTAQEVSSMLRHGLKPIIFVICNNGYTIERLIHGMDAVYNDVQNWNYTSLVPAFGGTESNSRTYQVKTKKELEALLDNEEFCEAKYLQFVEIYMPMEDAPKELKAVAEAAARTNRG